MKIHIITGHFYPQLHPRAFRANELALEFARRGYDVTVTNCWTIDNFDYNQYALDYNIKIRNLNFFITKDNNIKGAFSGNNKFSCFAKFLKDYLLAGRTLINARKLSQLINIEKDTDLVISLATPFTSILGLSYYIQKKGKKFVAIGDSGDPFYGSKQSPKAPWFYYIEKMAYKKLDYLTIPTANAIPIYSKVIDVNKIKIIPQGFNMDNVLLNKEEILPCPIKFAYAGVFYWDIRNPQFLFEYLNNLDVNFEFYLYQREQDDKLISLIDSLPNLKNKIFIKYSIPRNELLYALSKVHFLINIENQSNTQIPSKLIDYAITERPIFSCKSANFSPLIFDEFLKGNYEHRMVIDKNDYNIKFLVDKFLALV